MIFKSASATSTIFFSYPHKSLPNYYNYSCNSPQLLKRLIALEINEKKDKVKSTFFGPTLKRCASLLLQLLLLLQYNWWRLVVCCCCWLNIGTKILDKTQTTTIYLQWKAVVILSNSFILCIGRLRQRLPTHVRTPTPNSIMRRLALLQHTTTFILRAPLKPSTSSMLTIISLEDPRPTFIHDLLLLWYELLLYDYSHQIHNYYYNKRKTLTLLETAAAAAVSIDF